ncbi:hypothetical protein ACJMK2_028698 [Sinanodonta woodiana]|uniref:Histone-binding protein RBBP4-like N-terminal domain-containing protein n=1 Tax=Sinanodonta woodiana TaxID=1069815 RepID=A0ABD3X9E2_SINWO
MTEQEGRLSHAEEEILSDEDSDAYFNDFLVRHTLKERSITIQWLPVVTRPEGEDYSLHRLLLGTYTGQDQQNYLMIVTVIASVKVPHENHDCFNESESDRWNIEMKIYHQGEVNKVCYNPRNPCLIGTNNSSGDVLIFDSTKQPSVPDPSRKCTPELILKGHTQEGFGLSWNPIINGCIISASDDTTICLWDVNTTPTQGGTIDAMTIFTEHTSIVNDVAWHPSHQTMFGSVADDKRFKIWDTWLTCTAHICILATGSADENIVVWDIRNLSRKLYSVTTFQDANYQVHWSPHEKILASSGIDKNQSPLVDVICLERDGDVYELSWNLNEPWLISCVSDFGDVTIWQLAEHHYQQSLNVER